MAKKYTKNRIAREKKQKPLTLYENWIFENINKKGLSVEQTLKKRNKFTNKDLQKYKINSRYKQVRIESIYKSIKNIEKKLKSNILLTNKEKERQLIPKNCDWRLHAESFSIKILEKTPKYLKLLKEKNIDFLDNNTINLYENRLVVWANTDFWGESPEECLKNSAKYWNDFLKELQLKLGILVIKRHNTKIYKFRQHIAHIDDELAKYQLKQNKDFKVYDDKGELIFLADNSFNFTEGEWVHNEKAPQGASMQHKFIKDLDKYQDSLVPSQLTRLSYENTKNISQLTNAIENLSQKLNLDKINYIEEKIDQLVQLQINQAKIIDTFLKPKENIIKDFKPSMDYFR